MSQLDFADQAPVFQLKGSMLAITILELAENDLERLDSQLATKVEQAPDFFNNTPLVLALDKLPNAAAVDLPRLIAVCRKHGLRTLALRTGDATLVRTAGRLDLPVLPPSGARERKLEIASKPAEPAPAPAAPAPPAEPAYRPTRVITTPIRGGQQIYAQGGDLIVLSSVSPGAELLADGNIHVYGPLRGRALAGIKGDASARIFCQQLAAEMVSIAGRYKVAEDLRREPAWGQAVRMSLSGDVLNIHRL
jgi:septum site-determining protein MinC